MLVRCFDLEPVDQGVERGILGIRAGQRARLHLDKGIRGPEAGEWNKREVAW
jgi:hypothetical protein